MERIFFSKTSNLGRLFLRTRGVQFRRTCQKFEAKFTLFLCSKADKNGKKSTFFGKEVFFKCFLDTKKKQFWQLCGSLSAKIQFFFSMSENSGRKFIKASEKLFSSKCYAGNWECSFDTPVGFSFAAVKVFFCSNFKTRSKVFPLQQIYFYYFSSECFLDTRFAILPTPPIKNR